MSAAHSEAGVKKAGADEIPAVEWVIGILGLLVVMTAIGALLYEALAGDKSPPDVKLIAQKIETLRNGYAVKVRARNEGGEPAARVGIEVELWEKSRLVETGATQFEYLPAHSEREAGVFFTHDPRAGEVRLRALGYEVP